MKYYMTYYIILHTDILLFKILRINILDLILLKSSSIKIRLPLPHR